MSNENAFLNLIRIEDKKDSTLFRALQLLANDVYKLDKAVFPPEPKETADQESVAIGGILPAVKNFTAVAYPTNLRLDWDMLRNAAHYQIKMGEDWDTAKPIIITSNDVANVDPIFLNLIYGTYTFIICPMNLSGELGDETRTTLVVSLIDPPKLDVDVVVANVLLRWSVPVSMWKIDYFIVYKNNLPIGAIYGTFKLLQEQVGGTYSYSIAAVDIVGNVSMMSAVKTVDLHDPSEFEFVDDLPADYTGDYVRTNKTTINGVEGVIGPTLVHTWEEHYIFFNFESPQDQVDKGYPLYYQPSYIGDGTYTEIFDFGEIQTNLKIVVDYNKQQIFGSTNISTLISYSEDGITWSDPVGGISIFADSFRYVKVVWTFTNIDDKSIAFIFNLKIVLNITLTLDSGSAVCSAADVNGTLITYNKIFKGISSVTATSSFSMQPLYVICHEINKDNFRALVFDSSGNRANADIDWKARGVI